MDEITPYFDDPEALTVDSRSFMMHCRVNNIDVSQGAHVDVYVLVVVSENPGLAPKKVIAS